MDEKLRKAMEKWGRISATCKKKLPMEQEPPPLPVLTDTELEHQLMSRLAKLRKLNTVICGIEVRIGRPLGNGERDKAAKSLKWMIERDIMESVSRGKAWH